MVKYRAVVEGRPYEIEIRDDASVWVDGVRREVDLSEANGQPAHSLLIDGRSFETQVRAGEAGELEVVVNGRTHRTYLSSGSGQSPSASTKAEQDKSLASGAQAWVKAPLPGLLVETRVAQGEQVREGDVVVVLESMKMHLELRAPRSGIVESLNASPGHEVDLDEVLAIIV